MANNIVIFCQKVINSTKYPLKESHCQSQVSSILSFKKNIIQLAALTRF